MNIAILTETITASAALTANRFCTQAGAVPAAGARVAGVTRTSGDIGALVPVDTMGTAIVEAAAAIVVGAAIETAADGRAVTRTSGATVASAITAATAAGQLIEVRLITN
jgi:hypothetical protein